MNYYKIIDKKTINEVIGSFRDSLALLRKNILIVVISFAVSLSYLPITVAERLYGEPTFGVALYALIILLITPFFFGGIYGMINRAQEGKNANIETFKREGKKHYFRLLAAYSIFFVVMLGVLLGATWISIIADFLVNKAGPHEMVWFLLLFISIILPLFLFFLQFFDVGIVVNDYGIIESFKESFYFVSMKTLSVAGFTILLVLLLSFIGVLKTFSISTSSAVLYTINILFLLRIVEVVLYSYRAVYYIQTKGRDIKCLI